MMKSTCHGSKCGGKGSGGDGSVPLLVAEMWTGSNLENGKLTTILQSLVEFTKLKSLTKIMGHLLVFLHSNVEN